MKNIKVLSTILFLALFLFPLITISAEEPASPVVEQEKGASLSLEEKKSGLITMDFEDADIRDVIKVIAMASGMNMVIGKDVEAKVTISLKEVPWEKALDVILRTYNFSYKKEENLIRIMTFEKVKQEERDIPLTTKIVYLNFADVSDLQEPLKNILSERGTIQVENRTNSMIISDIPAKVEEIEKIAKTLDTMTPQVLIEAMLVNVSLTKDDQLGINWKIIHVDRPIEQGASPNWIEQPSDPMNQVAGAINLGFLKEFGGYDLSGLISAWVHEGKANILASPKIVTLDNQTAKIEIKSQVAYTQVTESDQGGNTTSTQFKDVTTGLEVTPHITKEGFISMNVKPRQEFVGDVVGGEPSIASRSAETNVLIKDGETVVIGGLRSIEDRSIIYKVPILGDIPIIGNIFRRKELQKVNTELVMFVTPHIIPHPKLTSEERDRYRMLDEAREEFLQQIEKEKQENLKKRKSQAFLLEPEISEDIPVAEEKEIGIQEPAVLPEVKDYIYSW